MSYFIHVCNANDLTPFERNGIPLRLKEGSSSLLLSAYVPPEGAVRRRMGAEEVEGVYAETATDKELADNSGKGADFRFEMMAVRAEPPTFAFYSQASGDVQWLSFDPRQPTVTFAAEVGASEEFQLELVDTCTGYRAIYSPAHRMYLTLREVGGRVCLQGTANADDRAVFKFDASLGTGPLMPGREYYVKTILGTVLRPGRERVEQSYEDGAQEAFLVEATAGGPRAPAGVKCYRFRTYDGRYVVVEPRRASPYGELGFTTDKADTATAFMLASDPQILGTFKVIHVNTKLTLRAESKDDSMTVGLPIASYICDCFALQTVTTGRLGALDGRVKRVGPIVKCPVPRTHPELKHNKEAAMRAAGAVPTQAAARRPAGPSPYAARARAGDAARHLPPAHALRPHSAAARAAAAPPAPAWAAPRADVYLPPAHAVAPHEVAIEMGKAEVEEEQRVAVVARAWTSKKWLILALAAGFIVALLFAAQVVVSRNGGRFSHAPSGSDATPALLTSTSESPLNFQSTSAHRTTHTHAPRTTAAPRTTPFPSNQ